MQQPFTLQQNSVVHYIHDIFNSILYFVYDLFFLDKYLYLWLQF